MDAFRKVPDNVPNKDLMEANLGKTADQGARSVSATNITALALPIMHGLRAFLDNFGFDYEFASSTDYYTSGRFDAALLRMLECYDDVMKVILPTPWGKSASRPIHPSCRFARALALYCRFPSRHAILIRAPSPMTTRKPVSRLSCRSQGGMWKCQWKADWALRWYAFGHRL